MIGELVEQARVGCRRGFGRLGDVGELGLQRLSHHPAIFGRTADTLRVSDGAPVCAVVADLL
jgi:hypothetical protein